MNIASAAARYSPTRHRGDNGDDDCEVGGNLAREEAADGVVENPVAGHKSKDRRGIDAEYRTEHTSDVQQQ